MVNTNSKEFRAKVQAYIRRAVYGDGGVTRLFKDCEYLAKSNRTNFYNGAYEYVMGGGFAISNYDIVNDMKKWGLTDEKKLWNYRTWKGDVGPIYLYAHLIASNTERMYEQYKKKKAAPKKKVVKKPKTRTVTERVPMTFGMVEQSRTVRRK